jgi:pimeloyl-ACP methyl ester carboxylesterase
VRACAVIALALGLLGWACGGGEDAPTTTAVQELCSPPQTGFSFSAADGARLVGVMRGEGRVGVVLAHGYGASLCVELPLVDDLARRGYRVLAYDARGFGASSLPDDPVAASRFTADVEGAAAVLREAGAETIFLVGDSFGGTTVVAAAPYVEPAPAGVVSVGGPASLRTAFGDVAEDLDALRLPPDARRLRRAPTTDRRRSPRSARRRECRR